MKKIGAYDLIEVITGGRKEGQLPPETEMRKERLEMELTQLARQGNKEDAPEEQITSTVNLDRLLNFDSGLIFTCLAYLIQFILNVITFGYLSLQRLMRTT